MDDIAQFIDSRPLIGIDHNHLNSILHALVRNQQQLHQSTSQLTWRVQQLDQAVQEVADQQRGIEQAVQQLSQTEGDGRNLRAHVQDLSTVVDNLARQTVPELRRGVDELRRNTLPPMERALQTVEQNVAQLARAQDERGRESDHNLRQVQGQLSSLQTAVDEQDRDRGSDLNRIADAVRDLQGRLERQERGGGGGGQAWRDAIEDLTNHANNNFHQIELSAKAVDAELNRIRTDLANVRTDVNTLDNNTRQKFAKVTDDSDNKFEMILGLLQNYERSSTELEEHLAAAGRALASSKSAGGPMSIGRTTTTTTAMRGGNLTSDVRSEPASGRRGVSGGW